MEMKLQFAMDNVYDWLSSVRINPIPISRLNSPLFSLILLAYNCSTYAFKYMVT